MKRKLAGLMAGALMAVSAISAASASAATEFGDSCVGNRLTQTNPIVLFDVSAPEDPLPLTAPSAGVITKWKVHLIDEAVGITFPQTLKVFHSTGPNTVQNVGEATGTVAAGINTYETRIPVQASDRVALFGSNALFEGEEAGNLFCEGSIENSVIGGILGSGGGVGTTSSFVQEPSKARVPVSAVVEPDADNDGYGDETQDKCPQSAAAQIACPQVALSTSSNVKRGLVTVLVTANIQATVTVAGTVKLGKGKSATLNGGTQIVAPGALAKFTLLFPKALRTKLKGLSPKRLLTLNLAATAPNVVGNPSSSNLSLKLKGQAKPKPHRKAKH
jgi:hypothetical protein